MIELGFVSLALRDLHFDIGIDRGSDIFYVTLPESPTVPVVRVLNHKLDFIVEGDFPERHDLRGGGVLYFQEGGHKVTTLYPPEGSSVLADSPFGFITVSFTHTRTWGEAVLGLWDPNTGLETSLCVYSSFDHLFVDALFGRSVVLSEKGLKPFSPFHLLGLNGSWYSQDYGFLSSATDGQGLSISGRRLTLKSGRAVNFLTGNARWAGVSLTLSSNDNPLNYYWSPMSRMVEYHQNEWMSVMIIDMKEKKIVKYLDNTFAVYFPDQHSVVKLANRYLSFCKPDSVTGE